GHFLTDPQGRPIANDFVNVWAAGRLALDGAAPVAYDWTLHRAAEVRAIGYDFDGYYGWHYPPPAFFFAAALATLPYLVAAVVWLVTTLAAYAAAIAGILGLRTGVLFALGFPAAIWNVTAGQNGFLTAALIGGMLGLLERHPALAGICLGLLTYKPQFGLLFPIVLIVDRRWLTIAVAALTAIALAALSWLAFGSASWEAFVHWAPLSSHALIDEGALDWYRLQSVFALVRAHGGSETLAWTVQGILSLALAVGLAWLWQSRVAFELKAAALASGALLATPYLFMYDLVVLAVAVAFLLRLALAREFLSRIEIAALTAAGVLILIYPYVKTHVGLAAVVIVMALIVHRAGTQARTALADKT
ncbi:MAG TPA: glycosyltransferase family 87 protein, partial [Xanthobacteraceae bacterium]|nr:glycosyltransferase family 87 protein [Xanthobacteraceae bacterium]